MASQARLDFSLQRSARLGLEVLARASRRSVDWTSISASQTPTTTDQDVRSSAEKTPTALSDAFANITESMAQTTYQCKRFYDSGCCTEPSDAERIHMSRFHTRLAGMTHPAVPPTKQHHVVAAAADEDFYIEVWPGSYTITASLPESQQQSHVVNLKAGESVHLTFNF